MDGDLMSRLLLLSLRCVALLVLAACGTSTDRADSPAGSASRLDALIERAWQFRLSEDPLLAT